jgi:hypothetical protein
MSAFPAAIGQDLPAGVQKVLASAPELHRCVVRFHAVNVGRSDAANTPFGRI